MTLLDTYEKDFFKWANDQAELLRKEEFTKLDMEHLIEEIEDLSKKEYDKLSSHLEKLLMHMLKKTFQPTKHTRSWDLSIKNSKLKANKVLKNNPSLKPKLKEILNETYEYSVLDAADETGLEENIFPEKCPWKLNEIFTDLEEKYW